MALEWAEIEVDSIPEGYKAVAYRRAEKGEPYFNDRRGVTVADGRTVFPWIVLEKVIKHREPTLADVGEMVEVSHGGNQWFEHELLGVLPQKVRERFITTMGKGDFSWWSYARIVDGGKPTQELAEGWVNVYHKDKTWHDSKEVADRLALPSRIRCFKAREVPE